jgi:hypothetical protein
VVIDMGNRVIVASSDDKTKWDNDDLPDHMHEVAEAPIDDFIAATPGDDNVEIHSRERATITVVWTCPRCHETCTTEEECHPSELDG